MLEVKNHPVRLLAKFAKEIKNVRNDWRLVPELLK